MLTAPLAVPQSVLVCCAHFTGVETETWTPDELLRLVGAEWDSRGRWGETMAGEEARQVGGQKAPPAPTCPWALRVQCCFAPGVWGALGHSRIVGRAGLVLVARAGSRSRMGIWCLRAWRSDLCVHSFEKTRQQDSAPRRPALGGGRGLGQLTQATGSDRAGGESRASGRGQVGPVGRAGGRDGRAHAPQECTGDLSSASPVGADPALPASPRSSWVRLFSNA